MPPRNTNGMTHTRSPTSVRAPAKATAKARARARPRAPPKCSKCGQFGHTRRNSICPQYSKITNRCSSCHSTNHNKRTCPHININEDQNDEYIYYNLQRYNSGDLSDINDSSDTDNDNPYGFDISGGNPSDTFGYLFTRGWNRAMSEDEDEDDCHSLEESWSDY